MLVIYLSTIGLGSNSRNSRTTTSKPARELVLGCFGLLLLLLLFFFSLFAVHWYPNQKIITTVHALIPAAPYSAQQDGAGSDCRTAAR